MPAATPVYAPFAPFVGVARGRCLGAGAIPTLPGERPYDAVAALPRREGLPDLVDDPASRLRVDATTGLYDFGFALLSLDGPALSAAYYSFDEARGAAVVHEERM